MGTAASVPPQDASTFSFHPPVPDDQPLHVVKVEGHLHSSASNSGNPTKPDSEAERVTYQLYHQIFFPAEADKMTKKDPKSHRGLIVFAHGVLEHSSRYRHVMMLLAHRGYVVCAQDHLSHGQSDDHKKGGRGYASFNCARKDLVQFVRYARQQVEQGLPTFLWGQSWGGGLSSLAAYDLQTSGEGLTGVILTSPAIERPDELILKIQAPFGNAIRAAVPAAKIVPGAPPLMMSSSSEEVTRYVQDPLNSPGNMPVETAQSTALAMDEIKKLKGGFVFPILGIHGSQDKVLAPSATERLIEGVSSKDKKFVKLEGFWHTCFHEPGWMDVFKIMEQWLQERTGGDKQSEGLETETSVSA